MSAPRPLRLDFVAPVHRAPLAGAALCAAGLAAAIALGLAFRRELAERNLLDAEVGALTPPAPHGAPSPASLRTAAEAAAMDRELGLAWTRLLAELEDAARDDASTVSLLLVEPDPAKQLVRLRAEVRALPDALAFVRRLQKSPVLGHPMLESHERRADDPDHPLRIQLSAEWRP